MLDTGSFMRLTVDAMTTTNQPTTKRVDLASRYDSEIRSWDWDSIKAETENNLFIDDGLRGSSFLGSVFSLMPSGKYYMPWSTNQSHRDEIMDGVFMECLESIAEEYGLWINSGEGDLCDLFAECCFGEEYYVVHDYSPDGEATHVRLVDERGNEVYDGPESEAADWMEQDGFMPDLVTISDHGNVSRYSLES